MLLKVRGRLKRSCVSLRLQNGFIFPWGGGEAPERCSDLPKSIQRIRNVDKTGTRAGAWRGRPRCLLPARLGRVPFLHAWLGHHTEA